MRYYALYDEANLLAIGTGYGGEEISETEYNKLMAIIQNAPKSNGKGYKLRTDLTWEEYNLPPVVLSDDDELTDEEAYNIIMGVSE